MSPRVIASRYAQALFELSMREGNTEQVATEMQTLLTLHQESRLLRNILESPIYTGPRKISWLRPLFETRLSPLLWNFLLLLIRRGREYLLNETCEAFLAIYDSHKKRLRVTLRSAQPLSEAVKTTLSEKLQTTFGATEVLLTESLDPSLIGGFVLEVGTQVADLSVRGQLRQIQKSLFSN